jgi:hypothetical protein|tara:strand:- start:61 stop:954 length:894 start_codon:yes stop_codon:yes gene_type:complete
MTDIKDMDIWVVGDSYAHGYRTAVKDYQLNKRVKKDVGSQYDWCLMLKKKYKNLKVGAITGADNLTTSSHLQHILEHHYTDNMFIILLYSAPMRDIAPLKGVTEYNTFQIKENLNWQASRFGHEVECGCTADRDATHTSFGSGWKHAFYNQKGYWPWEGFAAIPEDMKPIVADIENQIGEEAFDSMTDYKHYKGLWNVQHEAETVYSMLAKMERKKVPFLWGSAKHWYKPYDTYINIADYCRKDFNSSFVDVDHLDGGKRIANDYSMFYVNHLNLEQNYEWAEMFDKRLQNYRRPIA